MDNAARALLIGAEVLIGCLILSLAVYMYSDFAVIAREVQEQSDQKIIRQYNAQFEPYVNSTNTSSVYDALEMYSNVMDNNKYYVHSDGDFVLQGTTFVLDGDVYGTYNAASETGFTELTSQEITELLEDMLGELVEVEKNNVKEYKPAQGYSVTLTYGENGKVNSVILTSGDADYYADDN